MTLPLPLSTIGQQMTPFAPDRRITFRQQSCCQGRFRKGEVASHFAPGISPGVPASSHYPAKTPPVVQKRENPRGKLGGGATRALRFVIMLDRLT